MSGDENIPAPLAGIRVLDFTHVLAGPFCTRLLADLGADVVRIESSKHPDHPWPSTFVSEDKRHASYLNTNRSKRSVAVDLKNEAGQRIAARLSAAADIVIENFSAGVMDRLGLGYERLSAAHPKLIYISMSGYGHDGPRRDWTSMNMNLQGYSGLMMVSGAEGDPPTAISNSWNDYIGGLHACFAIVQAVDDAARYRPWNADRSQPVRMQRGDDWRVVVEERRGRDSPKPAGKPLRAIRTARCLSLRRDRQLVRIVGRERRTMAGTG